MKGDLEFKEFIQKKYDEFNDICTELVTTASAGDRSDQSKRCDKLTDRVNKTLQTVASSHWQDEPGFLPFVAAMTSAAKSAQLTHEAIDIEIRATDLKHRSAILLQLGTDMREDANVFFRHANFEASKNVE